MEYTTLPEPASTSATPLGAAMTAPDSPSPAVPAAAPDRAAAPGPTGGTEGQPVSLLQRLDPDGPDGLARPWAAGLAATALVWPAVAGRLWGPQRLSTGIWYRLLRKPGFKPPDAAIPVAWTLIDSALALGAYRLLRSPDSAPRNKALGWWALNVGLIGGWSGLFFGRRNLPASTAVAAAMVGTGAAYVAQAKAVDRPAAVAGVPFVGWVAFATVLTAAIWRRNR